MSPNHPEHDPRVHTVIGVAPFARPPEPALAPIPRLTPTLVLPELPADDDDLSDLVRTGLKHPDSEVKAKQRMAAAADTEHERLVAEQQYAQQLLIYSEKLRQSEELARRAILHLEREIAHRDRIAAAHDRTAELNQHVRSSVPHAVVSPAIVPPEDGAAFEDYPLEPTTFFPRGTDPLTPVINADPDADAQVIELPIVSMRLEEPS